MRGTVAEKKKEFLAVAGGYTLRAAVLGAGTVAIKV